jgi:hypothetical protein
MNGQEAAFERVILEALHYPQEPTVLYTDNDTAVGIANDSVKIRRSKAIDMRYNWIRDRVRQGIFKVVYHKGADIDADFLTKPRATCCVQTQALHLSIYAPAQTTRLNVERVC